LLTAPWVTPSSDAAATVDPSRAQASNAQTAFSGGSLRRL